MRKVLIAGAGKSSYFLLTYMLQQANKQKWQIFILDSNLDSIKDKTDGFSNYIPIVIDLSNDVERRKVVSSMDMIVSLMPPHLHVLFAKDCIDFKKPLVTASYISEELKSMEPQIKAAGIPFMCELGLDPGIDHMTAAELFHGIRKISGDIVSFKSYCGGLIAPANDNNSWHYKFSWNPRNVVIAGQGGANFLQNFRKVHVPYSELFNENNIITTTNKETFGWYANRDSLAYRDIYDIPEITNLMRATLRHPDFIMGWSALVSMGMTSTEPLKDFNGQSLSDLVAFKIGASNMQTDRKTLVSNFLGTKPESKLMKMLDDLDLFSIKPTIKPTPDLSAADVLLNVLLNKWEMHPKDKDRVVMHHEVEYISRGKKYLIKSSMDIVGQNEDKTAMAKTVGLPMAIFTKNYLSGKMKLEPGLHIPISPNVYRPILTELAHFGIEFTESFD